MAADRKHRTSARVLRRLSEGNMVYEAPGASRGDWDRFAIRNVGLAVGHRMATEYEGDAEKIRASSVRQAARALGLRVERLSTLELRAFNDLALVLGLIGDLAQWTKSERKSVAQIVRAKMGIEETRYARLLQNHPRLRAAIIRLGEARANET
jgi:hypothetical protein